MYRHSSSLLKRIRKVNIHVTDVRVMLWSMLSNVATRLMELRERSVEWYFDKII